MCTATGGAKTQTLMEMSPSQGLDVVLEETVSQWVARLAALA